MTSGDVKDEILRADDVGSSGMGTSVNEPPGSQPEALALGHRGQPGGESSEGAAGVSGAAAGAPTDGQPAAQGAAMDASAVIVKRRGRGRPKKDTSLYTCKVDGCNVILNDVCPRIPRHLLVYKICMQHSRALSVVYNGTDHRYCQTCRKLQPVGDFGRYTSSCRQSLLAHKERRRLTKNRLRAQKEAEQALGLAGATAKTGLGVADAAGSLDLSLKLEMTAKAAAAAADVVGVQGAGFLGDLSGLGGMPRQRRSSEVSAISVASGLGGMPLGGGSSATSGVSAIEQLALLQQAEAAGGRAGGAGAAGALGGLGMLPISRAPFQQPGLPGIAMPGLNLGRLLLDQQQGLANAFQQQPQQAAAPVQQGADQGGVMKGLAGGITYPSFLQQLAMGLDHKSAPNGQASAAAPMTAAPAQQGVLAPDLRMQVAAQAQQPRQQLQPQAQGGINIAGMQQQQQQQQQQELLMASYMANLSSVYGGLMQQQQNQLQQLQQFNQLSQGGVDHGQDKGGGGGISMAGGEGVTVAGLRAPGEGIRSWGGGGEDNLKPTNVNDAQV